MLIDSVTNSEIKLPKIHGNTKVRNPITGQKDRTLSQWRRAGKESAEKLIKAFGK
jgi:hypothetical protein